MDDDGIRKIVINDGEVAKFSDGSFVNRTFLFRDPIFGEIVSQGVGVPSAETFKWAFKYGFTEDQVRQRLRHSDDFGFESAAH